ncbi:hypothetical protein BDV96DRAFT_644913 [Lophiotrema nucula]|uniref:Uncharacterized protein n=1 Tax=Lophiotrema nucula TaxID=690887 RepID=A0A6A5ZCJ1_9PLEO|nr:hypothetical protein BDV96DRAFT_644913 [Lophiotrema nucula]
MPTFRHRPISIKEQLAQAIAEVHKVSHLPTNAVQPSRQLLSRVLQEWKEDLESPGPTPQYLVHVFDIEDHQQERPNIDSIDREDQRARLTFHQILLATEGFKLFVGRVVKIATLRHRSNGIQLPHLEHENTYSFDGLFDIDGTKLISHLPLPDGSISTYGFLNSIDARSEPEKRALAIIIIPESEFVDFLYSGCEFGEDSTGEILSFLSTKCTTGQVQHRYKSHFQRLLRGRIKTFEVRLSSQHSFDTGGTDDTPLAWIAAHCLAMYHIGLFERAVKCFRDAPPQSFWRGIRRAMDWLSFEDMVNGLDICASRCRDYSSLFEALNELLEGGICEQSSNSHAVSAWIKGKLQDRLAADTKDPAEQAKTLLRLAAKHNGNDFLTRKALSLLVSNIGITPTVIHFLNRLYTIEGLARSNIAAVFHKLVPLLPHARALLWWCQNVPSGHYRKDSIGNEVPAVENLGWPQELVTFLGFCLTLGLADNVQQMLDQLRLNAAHLASNSYSWSILPLLKNFAERGYSSYAPMAVRDIYKHFLEDYLQVCVGTEPRMSEPDWTRPPVAAYACEWEHVGVCADCTALNHFLTNPRASSFDCAVASLEAQKHIYRKTLQAMNCKCIVGDRTFRGWELLIVKENIDVDPNYKAKHVAWEQRKQEAAYELSKVHQPSLKQLLGVHYAEILEMRSIMAVQTLAHGSPPPSPAQSRFASRIQSLSGPNGVGVPIETLPEIDDQRRSMTVQRPSSRRSLSTVSPQTGAHSSQQNFPYNSSFPQGHTRSSWMQNIDLESTITTTDPSAQQHIEYGGVEPRLESPATGLTADAKPVVW